MRRYNASRMGRTPFQPRDFIHPEDRAAIEQLRAVPLFSQCLQAFMKVVPERLFHGINMAQKVRLSERQLPDIYRYLPVACEALGIDAPEFYLEMNPMPNAYTYGDRQPYLTVTSGLITDLTEEEVQAVVAHECGHVVCQHTLYHTMASLLALVGPQIFGPLATLSMPVRLALLYWVRRSELSADRAAAVVMGSAQPVVDSFARLAGGPKSITDRIDMDLYAEQAAEYDKLNESQWDQLLQNLAVMTRTHPFLTVRTREIHTWAGTDEFQRLVERARRRGEPEGDADTTHCVNCGEAVESHWKFCRSCGAGLAARSGETSAK